MSFDFVASPCDANLKHRLRLIPAPPPVTNTHSVLYRFFKSGTLRIDISSSGMKVVTSQMNVGIASIRSR